MKILIAAPYDANVADRIQQIARTYPDPKIETTFAPSRDELLKDVEDAEILVRAFDQGLLLKARKLKWAHVISAGVDMYRFPEFLESDIVLTCGKGMVGIHLAEHAFGLLLALTRGIAPAIQHRIWHGYSYQSLELYGKVMGIIGFGGTGREIALRAHAFGMKVLAIDSNDVPKPNFIEEIWKPDQLPRLLSKSDVVMIGLPLTDQTHGLFNHDAFQQMKRTAFLINVTRGKIMDMDALVEALDKAWIAGAGLDVVPEEPLPSDSPLWKMENVIITPHSAGVSPARSGRSWDQFMENLPRWLNGEPLLGAFNREQGF